MAWSKGSAVAQSRNSAGQNPRQGGMLRDLMQHSARLITSGH